MTLRPKKSLGQHFLNSKHVLDQIISAADIKADENILEIGPGTGVLTEALITSGAKVVAVEMDERSVDMLKEKFSKEISASQLQLIRGDILAPSSFLLPPSFSIIANIPYYITGAILEKFLEHEPRPSRMVLLVQKEVAKRILGSLPGGEGKESVLSISVKSFGTPKIIATVPPGAFTPPPTVDSAILSIENISADTFSSEESSDVAIRFFFSIVKAGFAHKRKFLIRNLEILMDKDALKSLWGGLNLNEKIRAEDLTVEQWLQIATMGLSKKKSG